MPHAFFGTFFRVERKYYPPSGRQPHLSRRSRRVNPLRGKEYAPAGAPKGFPLALWKPSDTEAGEKTRGQQVPPRAGVGASISTGAGACACRRTKGLSARPLETFGHRSWQETKRAASPTSRAGVSASIPLAEILYDKADVCRCMQVTFLRASNRPSHTAVYSSFAFIPL